MSRLSTARKELADYLGDELGIPSYPGPAPGADLPSIHLRPNDGDDGYVSRQDDRNSFTEWMITYVARLGLVHRGEDAEIEEIDNRIAQLNEAFPVRLVVGAEVHIERILTPGTPSDGDTNYRALDVVLSVQLTGSLT